MVRLLPNTAYHKQAGILSGEFCCVFLLPQIFLTDIKVRTLLHDASFPLRKQTSSSESPAETSRHSVKQPLPNQAPGELKSSCITLRTEEELMDRDALLRHKERSSAVLVSRQYLRTLLRTRRARSEPRSCYETSL